MEEPRIRVEDFTKPGMSTVGHLVVKYKHLETSEAQVRGGSASLYGKLNDQYYVLLTCAHNFTADEDTEYVAGMFFLQRRGMNKYLARFSIKEYFIHPDFEAQNDHSGLIIPGCDIALALV